MDNIDTMVADLLCMGRMSSSDCSMSETSQLVAQYMKDYEYTVSDTYSCLVNPKQLLSYFEDEHGVNSDDSDKSIDRMFIDYCANFRAGALSEVFVGDMLSHIRAWVDDSFDEQIDDHFRDNYDDVDQHLFYQSTEGLAYTSKDGGCYE